jgi:HlyD family secretion protein
VGELRDFLHRVATVLGSVCLLACSPQTDRPLQGYVEGEYVRVAAPFAGTLQKLAVQRGTQVDAGAPLFALENENEIAARRQAEQQLQAAEARRENLKTGKRPPEVATVAEQLRQAQAARELSVANVRRQEALFKSGFISKAALDDVRTQLQRDDAAVEQMQASVTTAKLPARPDEIRAAEADAAAARDALAQADWKLSQRAVGAPTAARVVPETELGRIRTGQTVSFSCDACGAPMSAIISFVSDHAEFTPPVLYSKENRAKLVYLVEARPSPEVAVKLNAGQPVDVALPRPS